jgi:hypothetical protein
MTELPSRPKPPAIREVARAAGVSTALVSIVLGGAPGASEQTRAGCSRRPSRSATVPTVPRA